MMQYIIKNIRTISGAQGFILIEVMLACLVGIAFLTIASIYQGGMYRMSRATSRNLHAASCAYHAMSSCSDIGTMYDEEFLIQIKQLPVCRLSSSMRDQGLTDEFSNHMNLCVATVSWEDGSEKHESSFISMDLL